MTFVVFETKHQSDSKFSFQIAFLSKKRPKIGQKCLLIVRQTALQTFSTASQNASKRTTQYQKYKILHSGEGSYSELWQTRYTNRSLQPACSPNKYVTLEKYYARNLYNGSIVMPKSFSHTLLDGAVNCSL